MSVQMSFDDALKGVTTKISVPQTVDCDACGGSGRGPGHESDDVPSVPRTGSVNASQGFFSINSALPQLRRCRQGDREPVRCM